MNKAFFFFLFSFSFLISTHVYADEIAYRKFLGAIKDKDLERLNTILKSGFEINAEYGQQHLKFTPLAIVISHQTMPNDPFTEKAVKLLIENGAIPEQFGPLETVARKGFTNLTELFLEKITPSEKGTKAYCSALSSTLDLRVINLKLNSKGQSNKDIDLNNATINLMLQKKWTQKFMSVASIQSIMEMLKYFNKDEIAIMVANGVNFNRLTYGIPASFFALDNLGAMNKPEEIRNFIETLRAAKVDLNAKTDSGFTMAMKAAELDNQIVLKELHQAKLLTFDRTKSGFTAIDYAAAKQLDKNIQYLAMLGFKVSPLNELFQIEQTPGYLLFGERQDLVMLARTKNALSGPKINPIFSLSLKPEITIGELNDFLKKNNLRIAMETPLPELMIGEARILPFSKAEKAKIIEISKNLKWIDKLEDYQGAQYSFSNFRFADENPKPPLVCDKDAKNVANYFKLDELQSCKTSPIGPENLKLRLVEIKYGKGMDCPAGCIYQTKNAIVDANNKIFAVEDPPRLRSLDQYKNKKALLESTVAMVYRTNSHIVYPNKAGSYGAIAEVECQPQGSAGDYSPYLEIEKFNWEIYMGQDTLCTYRSFSPNASTVKEGVTQISGKVSQNTDKQKEQFYDFSKVKFKNLTSVGFYRFEWKPLKLTGNSKATVLSPKSKNEGCLKSYPIPKIIALKVPIWRPAQTDNKIDILHLSVENFSDYKDATFVTPVTKGLSLSLWRSDTRLGTFEITSFESLQKMPIILNLEKESEVYLQIEDNACDKVYKSQTIRF